MRVIEESPGRLILQQRAVLAETVMVIFMAIFGVLAWVVYPVDYLLSMALLGCVIVGALLFLTMSIRTTVEFDRIHNVVKIRQQSFLRDRRREVAMADITKALLIADDPARPAAGGIVALALVPGHPKPNVPLTPQPVAGKVTEEAVGTINRWLGATA